MKILTAKEQLRSMLDDVEFTIVYSKGAYRKALNRKERKENWGVFSFILEEHWSLRYDCDCMLKQLNMLIAYKDMLEDLLMMEK